MQQQQQEQQQVQQQEQEHVQQQGLLFDDAELDAWQVEVSGVVREGLRDLRDTVGRVTLGIQRAVEVGH